MKSIKIYFYLAILLIVNSCQTDTHEILAYEEALKRCIPRDVTQPHKDSGGMMTLYGVVDADCILGAQLPAFTTATMEGVTIDTAFFENKITVINFWFIRCKPCVAEMPRFNEIVKRYQGKPVNFLSISNSSPDDIMEFLLEHPFNFQHVAYGEQIYRGNFQEKWGYPMTLIVDDNMKIVGVFDRGMAGKEVEILNAIDEALSAL